MAADTDPVFRPPSAVERIAQHLREKALNMTEGDYIGSEQSLSREYFVSGPTLRQAVRLLEHEGLVKVRRGVRGGYYVGRQNIDALIRAAATYLHGSVSSFEEIKELTAFLIPLVADRIIANERFHEIGKYTEPFHSQSFDEFVQQQLDYMKLVIELIDNVPLQFFMTVLLQTIASLPLHYGAENIEGIRNFESLRVDFARAVLDKDRERAIAAYSRAHGLVMNVVKLHLDGGAPAKT